MKHEDCFVIVVLEICESVIHTEVARGWQIMENIKLFNCTVCSIFSNSLFSTKWGHFLLVDALI